MQTRSGSAHSHRLAAVLLGGLFASHAARADVTITLVGQWGGPTRAVAVFGDLAYVGFGPALLILDIRDPAAPRLVGRTAALPGMVHGVAIADGCAYLASGEAGLQIVNVATPAEPVLVGSYDTSRWAENVAVAGNFAFVADGDGGFYVINVANPADPVWTGGYPTNGFAWGVAVAGPGSPKTWNPPGHGRYDDRQVAFRVSLRLEELACISAVFGTRCASARCFSSRSARRRAAGRTRPRSSAA